MTTRSSLGTGVVNQTADVEAVNTREEWLYKAGGVAGFAQLVCTLMHLIVVSALEIKPLGMETTTAETYFTVLQNDRLEGLLQLDFPNLLNVIFFAMTAFACYAALKQHNQVYAILATALVFIGVTLALATHPSFSMIHLSDRYAAATTDAQRSMYLAAGEAVIASDWWNSMGGFTAGLFLQGGMVLMSLIMLQSKAFGRATAYTGILANGLDWIHVPIDLFLPDVSFAILAIGGLFYLVWFPLLGRDLYRLGRNVPQSS